MSYSSVFVERPPLWEERGPQYSRSRIGERRNRYDVRYLLSTVSGDRLCWPATPGDHDVNVVLVDMTRSDAAARGEGRALRSAYCLYDVD